MLPRTLLIVLLLAGLAAPATTSQAATPGAATLAAGREPNVVVILTDDMRRDDLRYMRYTRRLFAERGTSFTHALSPHPLCCPARAELVTGRYAQNNGVHANKGPWGGYAALEDKDSLIFRWFRRAGYRTSYVGKFLNGYEDLPTRAQHIPGLVENNIAVRGIYRPHRVVVQNNGDPTRLRGHQTPATTRSVIQSIRRAGKRPFFAWAGYVAPHAMSGGAKFAPVPPGGYPLRPAHRRPPSLSLPSFNAERPWGTRTMSPETVRTVHRARVRSLYAVDDGVRRIVGALKRRGVYRDTVIVFASDNGMAMGSHGLMTKNVPYQDVVRVPLLMTGPGVPRRQVDEVTTLVDLPGTLARLTGVRPMLSQDGGDLFSQPADRAVLIQAGDAGVEWRWRGVYTSRYTFVDYGEGVVELFDRANDPHETTNLADDPGSTPVRNDLAALLGRLARCAVDTCRATY